MGRKGWMGGRVMACLLGGVRFDETIFPFIYLFACCYACMMVWHWKGTAIWEFTSPHACILVNGKKKKTFALGGFV